MADLIMFPGVRREAIPDSQPQAATSGNPYVAELTDTDVLQKAIEQKVEDVVVVGFLPDGSFYVASAVGDDDAVVGKLFRAASFISSLTLDLEEEEL